jgi:hypothetical protein
VKNIIANIKEKVKNYLNHPTKECRVPVVTGVTWCNISDLNNKKVPLRR